MSEQPTSGQIIIGYVLTQLPHPSWIVDTMETRFTVTLEQSGSARLLALAQRFESVVLLERPSREKLEQDLKSHPGVRTPDGSAQQRIMEALAMQGVAKAVRQVPRNGYWTVACLEETAHNFAIGHPGSSLKTPKSAAADPVPFRGLNFENPTFNHSNRGSPFGWL